jgi:two-component system, cell cycle sensor histidine kinase and response regulator CckA
MLSDSVNLPSTILIVDDEEFLLQYVRLVLVRAGYLVLTAENGEKAWDLIADNSQEIRLLLTDIVMPGSFDGFELSERVRKSHPGLPVLFMTGAPLEANVKDGLTGQRKLLRKPFLPQQLLTIVGESLKAANRS